MQRYKLKETFIRTYLFISLRSISYIYLLRLAAYYDQTEIWFYWIPFTHRGSTNNDIHIILNASNRYEAILQYNKRKNIEIQFDAGETSFNSQLILSYVFDRTYNDFIVLTLRILRLHLWYMWYFSNFLRLLSTFVAKSQISFIELKEVFNYKILRNFQ